MRKDLLVCLLAIASVLVSCDSTPEFKPLPERNDACRCYDTLIVNETDSRFPFTDDVVAVAYEYKNDSGSTSEMSTCAEWARLDTNGRFDPAYINRIDTLNKREKKELEKILFNRNEICTGEYTESMTACSYLPHHCIVFFQNDSVVAYLELCFICDHTKAWPETNYFGSRCGDYECEMRYFFRAMGFSEEMLKIYNCSGYVPDSTEIWKGKYSN